MPRSALPQNYIKNSGTLIEDFENLSEWTLGGNAINPAISQDTVNVKTGESSLILSGSSDSTSRAINVDKTISRKFSDSFMWVWIFVYTEPETIGRVGIYLSSTTNFSKYFYSIVDGPFEQGWNRLGVVSWSSVGGESWDNTMIRMRVVLKPAANTTAEAAFDSFYANAQGMARCLVTFDDCHQSVMDAYGIMNPLGIIGTGYTIASYIDVVATALTFSNCQTLYNAGWALAGHSWDHPMLTQIPIDEATEQMRDCRDWLIENGFMRAAYHQAWPGGFYNQSTIEAARDLGILTSRCSDNGFQTFNTNLHHLLSKVVLNTTSLATAKGWIYSAIQRGATVILMFHHLATPASTTYDWTHADFQSLMEYVAASNIECVTIDEWYKGLTNPRYRSLPLARAAT
jgi:peptidoglycan/xylan/chitin deacetylase (PgdA/CDA1 family)